MPAKKEGDSVWQGFEAKEDVQQNAPVERVRRPGEGGCTDPTKVMRTALINAMSISSLTLTAEAMVSELLEDKNALAARRH